jgi:hypothetical protein
MTLIGCDVFLYWPRETMPDVPKAVGPLKLEFISNRATRVWPAGSAKLDYHADEWRCRFTSEGDKAVDQRDIDELLDQIVGKKNSWTNVQVLWLGEDGSRAFSQPY